jgi:hypothetical protein
MRGNALAAAVVVGAVEILNIMVALIEMEIEIAAAIGAPQKAGKHIFLAVKGLALAYLPALLLYLFPYFPLDDGRVYVLENRPIFLAVR